MSPPRKSYLRTSQSPDKFRADSEHVFDTAFEQDDMCDLNDDDDQEAQGDVQLRMKAREEQDDLLRILSNSLAMNERSKDML